MRKINLACIIDDEPMHVFLTKKYLEMSGMIESIMVCHNGKDAYDKLRSIMLSGEVLPEIILLDLNMPVWDGWKFLDEFTKIEVKQPITIFIVTSSTNYADRKKAEEYNLKSNYIVKPINPKDLMAILD